MTVRQFHRAASYSLEDLLDVVEVDTYNGDYGISIRPNDTERWKEQSDFSFGFCYTLELPRHLTTQVIRKITIRTKKG